MWDGGEQRMGDCTPRFDSLVVGLCYHLYLWGLGMI